MEPAAFPAVTVIIPHYRQTAQLAECLACLARQDYPGATTILVIDNDTRFALAGWEARHPHVTFLWEPRPGSYSARNKGLEHTRDELIAFTDADCRPQPAWLREGVRMLSDDPAIGMVGGQIRVTPHHHDRLTACEAYELACAFRQDFYIEGVHFAATANMFTRRSLFEKLGRFDDTLKSSGDLQWGNRLYAAGWKLAYSPEACVEHPARGHAELRAKNLRIAGGYRDLAPGRWQALLFVLRRPCPHLRYVLWILTSTHPALSWTNKLRALLYHVYNHMQTNYYRLKVAFADRPSER